MTPEYRAMGEQIHHYHGNCTSSFTETVVRMPAYVKDRKVICFPWHKTEGYMTLGFFEDANLDQDHMRPTSFHLMSLLPPKKKRSGIGKEISEFIG